MCLERGRGGGEEKTIKSHKRMRYCFILSMKRTFQSHLELKNWKNISNVLMMFTFFMSDK